VFYGRYGNTYRVIRAPIGFVISALPLYHDVIWIGNRQVFYYDGVFYEYDRWRGGYVVIPAPYGVEVEYLPEEYDEVWHDDELYYHSRGVHYRPVHRSGVTFFLTVRF
jgi:hypothetical protein